MINFLINVQNQSRGIPFEGYEGMTQLQFQESNAPFLKNGGQVPVSVPPGWRRVESKMPGAAQSSVCLT